MTRHAPLCARFIARIVPGPGGCWLWTGATNKGGYGQLKDGSRQLRAHRFAYEWLVGPVPAGLVLDHLCRVPACVNPWHLEPVTVRENTLRGLSGRLVTACPRGHDYIPENTIDRGYGRHCRACKRERERHRLPWPARKAARSA